MGLGEVASHLQPLVSLENSCAVSGTLQSKMEDRPRGTPQRREKHVLSLPQESTKMLVLEKRWKISVPDKSSSQIT